MTAIGAKPAAGAAMDIPSTIAGIILLLIIIGATYFLVGPTMMFYALIGVIVGGLLITFGVHFVPVGGALPQWGRHPVSRRAWQCSLPEQALPASSVVHGQLNRASLSQSSPAQSVAD